MNVTDRMELAVVLESMERALRERSRGLGEVAPWQVWQSQMGTHLSRQRVATLIAHGVRLDLVRRHGPYGIRETHYGYTLMPGWRRRMPR